MTRVYNTKEDRRLLVLAALKEIRRQYIASGYNKRKVFVSQIAAKYHVALPPFILFKDMLKDDITIQTADDVMQMLYVYNANKMAARRNEEKAVNFDDIDLDGVCEPSHQEPTQASIEFTYGDMEKLLGQLAAGVYGIRDKDGNDIPLPDEVNLGVLEMVANCVRMWGRIPNYKAFKIEHDAIISK